MSEKKITVVIVGMGFGKEFIPIYQSHPNIKAVGICTRNQNTLDELAEKFNLDKGLCFTEFDDIPKRNECRVKNFFIDLFSQATCRKSIISFHLQ